MIISHFLLAGNVQHFESHEISKGSKIAELEKWGKSFIVDFYLHYTGINSDLYVNTAGP